MLIFSHRSLASFFIASFIRLLFFSFLSLSVSSLGLTLLFESQEAGVWWGRLMNVVPARDGLKGIAQEVRLEP